MSTNIEIKAKQTYLGGYLFSVACTAAAYYALQYLGKSAWAITTAITVLAVTQVLVQLMTFLHLGSREMSPVVVVLVEITVVVAMTLIIGTIWIMHSLDYNMSHSSDSGAYILKDELIHH